MYLFYICIYLQPPEITASLAERAEKRYRPHFTPTLKTIVEVPGSLLSLGNHILTKLPGHSIVWSLFFHEIKCNRMTSFIEFMICNRFFQKSIQTGLTLYVCIFLQPPEITASLAERAEKRYRPHFTPTLKTIVEVPVSLLSIGDHIWTKLPGLYNLTVSHYKLLLMQPFMGRP